MGLDDFQYGLMLKSLQIDKYRHQRLHHSQLNYDRFLYGRHKDLVRHYS